MNLTQSHKVETRAELKQELLSGNECDANNGSY